ncbi:MarR family transcriptional regulator [Haladaptatus sp. F3-133]|jgi:predicted transcriptional regulator|uniref:MarR family transcriptional regulator n=1 Tax=Halorutilus salinus TaxID=2487751 RepID=A0A9Q4GHI8_9EURY|nr:MarR family transcriptional regulator [Halorutilus salinus]MCX2818825.1 MarR family transcriptional regulator [Halorutilus salinus]
MYKSTKVHRYAELILCMPISADEFEELEEETNAEVIVKFLSENEDKAFKASEIAGATDVDRNSVHPVLKRLRERELVRHKPPYWTVGDMEKVRAAYELHSVSSYLDSKLGEERREDWVDG